MPDDRLDPLAQRTLSDRRAHLSRLAPCHPRRAAASATRAGCALPAPARGQILRGPALFLSRGRFAPRPDRRELPAQPPHAAAPDHHLPGGHSLPARTPRLPGAPGHPPARPAPPAEDPDPPRRLRRALHRRPHRVLPSGSLLLRTATP